jgi:hypothetical protein
VSGLCAGWEAILRVGSGGRHVCDGGASTSRCGWERKLTRRPARQPCLERRTRSHTSRIKSGKQGATTAETGWTAHGPEQRLHPRHLPRFRTSEMFAGSGGLGDAVGAIDPRQRRRRLAPRHQSACWYFHPDLQRIPPPLRRFQVGPAMVHLCTRHIYAHRV